MVCLKKYDKVEQLAFVLYTCSLIQTIFSLLFIFGYFSNLINHDALLFTTMIMSFVNIVWIIYNTMFLIKDVVNKHNHTIHPVNV